MSSAEPAATTTSTTRPPTTTVPPAEELLPAGLEDLTLRSEISAGKMLDSVDQGASIRHGLADGGDQPDPERSDERFFTGEDADVIARLVTTAESEDLNPAGGRFAFQAVGVLLLDPTFDKLKNAPSRFSWNVMQRGLAGNPGGQWKMSLVNEDDGSVNAQCVVRDEENRFMRVNSSTALVPNEEATITCIFDDEQDKLSIDVNGKTDLFTNVVRKSVDGEEAVVDEMFGSVDPIAGGICSGDIPDGIGYAITVGNKPACGQTIADDDRFQGQITTARIWK